MDLSFSMFGIHDPSGFRFLVGESPKADLLGAPSPSLFTKNTTVALTRNGVRFEATVARGHIYDDSRPMSDMCPLGMYARV